MCHFLIKFLENLLFNGKNTLKNRYMHIAFDTVNIQNDTLNITNDTVNIQSDTVFSLIKQNNNITANEISSKLGKVYKRTKSLTIGCKNGFVVTL